MFYHKLANNVLACVLCLCSVFDLAPCLLCLASLSLASRFGWVCWKKALSTAPRGTESKEQYMARLERCARSLPRSTVWKSIEAMKERIQETFDNKGYHGKRD